MSLSVLMSGNVWWAIRRQFCVLVKCSSGSHQKEKRKQAEGIIPWNSAYFKFRFKSFPVMGGVYKLKRNGRECDVDLNMYKTYLCTYQNILPHPINHYFE